MGSGESHAGLGQALRICRALLIVSVILAAAIGIAVATRIPWQLAVILGIVALVNATRRTRILDAFGSASWASADQLERAGMLGGSGLCVGVGTIFFFVLFQKGGPLSAVPMILAGGAALMALAGIFFFHEKPSVARLLGIVLSVAGLFLLRR